MNKIYKVMYSKVKQCAVVVSEIAKSHGRHTKSSVAKSSAALTAAVLLALGAFSFVGMPSVQAADSLFSNDYVGTNYKKDNGSSYSASETKNYHGAGAEGVGSSTLGMNAIAGKNTITIGDRDASAATESVYIGAKYDANNQVHPSSGKSVVSVGYGSDAAGTGSIAIGSGASADAFDNAGEGKNPDKESHSIAIGNNAVAKQNNIAIGTNSMATDAASTTTPAAFTNQEAPKSYVSVGDGIKDSETQYRRISNVADGASASDVAAVGQLQALSDKVGVYDAGFGIKIDSDKDNKTNTISLNRNLGKDYDTTDDVNLKNDAAGTSLILGGRVEKGSPTGGQSVTGDYGALGRDSVTVGGVDNTVETTADAAVVVGGVYNKASGKMSTVVGGSANDAIGNESAVFGGQDNDAYETYATISGGSWNKAYGNASSIFGGSVNDVSGKSSVAVGGYGSHVYGDVSVGIAGGSTNADYALAAGNEATVTVQNGTAIGYQATANKEGTVAFGHDKGDVYYTSTWPQKATEKEGKYYDARNEEITEDQYEALRNADHTFNDYSQKPTVTENKYDAAAYNRLVKVADGQDDHDVVVMEQLTKATNDLTKDLSVNAGWGINVNDVTTKNDGGMETTTKNVISLNRNLGTNYGNPWKGEGKVTFEASGENSLILGGAASILQSNVNDNVNAGAYGKDSVLVGGFNNLIETNKIQTGEDAVIVGGDTNKVTGLRSVIIGGYQNNVSGGHSVVVGGASNEADGGGAGVFGGQSNKAAGEYSSVLGGDQNEADGGWSSAIGGTTNIASGRYATVLGGVSNDAKGNESAVVGGTSNVAIGEDSTVNGGAQNTSYGTSSYAAGGMNNMAFGNVSVALGGQYSSVNGISSTGIAGGSTGENAMLTLAAGYQSVVTDSGVKWRPITQDEADKINQGKYSWPGFSGKVDYGDGSSSPKVLDRISTAVGYQSTADAPGVIAFGHDKGDVASVAKKWKQKATEKDGKYYDANDKEILDEDYYKLVNADGTWNDYTQDPIGTENTTYQSAYYNRLVKAADGIDAHDAVVMEQLKPYTKSDASNVGANLKTYTVGDDGETITESDATPEKQKENKDAWGKALGSAPFTTGTDTTATNASTSDQLVTGKTLYNYDAPVAETGKTLNYVSANNTTGQNLLNLDRQVKTNTDTLSDVNSRSVKYDTKTENGKTVVDNTKITLAGEGGTTITNLKDGVKNNDAATVGQLDDRISGVTYEAGNGIDMSNKKISAVAGTGITVNAKGINVNTGKHLSVNTSGKVDVDDNGEVAADDGNLVTGKTVYDALHGGLDNITVGKDGQNGEDGSIGIAGQNGKDGYSITYIKTEQGAAGVDGKDGEDGITRVVYQDKDGNGKHTFATLDDGLKFKGDDSTVIARKLNEQLNITGGADSTNLTDKNIGVNSSTDGLKIQLAKNLAGITSIANQTTTGKGDAQTTTGAKIDLKDDGSISVNSGKITDVKSGLTATDGTYADTDKNNAANIGDVHSMIEKEAGNTDDKLALKANVAADNIGTHITDTTAQKTNLDNWGAAIGTGAVADSTNEHANQLVTGKTVYDALHGGLDNITVGKDGKDAVSISGKDGVGHIGLTGPAGTNGKDGASIDITVKNGYDKGGKDGKDGINGKNGVDGTSLTRIVYEDKNGEHQVATLEDGLKFKGDGDTVIAKKLNNTMEIIGGADNKNLTDKNIGVNSTTDGQLKVQLAKDLTDITSISNQKTTKVDDKDVTTGAKITLGTDGSVDVNGGKITHVGSGIEKDANNKYTVTDQNKGNAANIGDVQNIVNDAKKDLTEGTNGLNNKANVDASNIGSNITVAPIYQKDEKGQDLIGQNGQKVIDQKATEDAQKAARTANETAWGSAIGTGKIEKDNGQLVTGKTVYDEVRPKEDGNYVKTNQTTGANLSALDSKIGKLDANGNYIQKDASVSLNLSTLDTQVKANADAISKEKQDREAAITNITNNIGDLSNSAVKYDADSNKGKVTLAGANGTTITNLKAGAVTEASKDAVNGSQLYAEQKARTDADTKLTSDLAAETQARTDADTAINNKIGTLDKDGNYIKKDASVSSNLSTLDTQVKTTSDLIHTDANDDTIIQIGGSSTATKVDVSGKDKDGKSTGRIITGVVTDAADPTSAANVGYVNGVTSANTQQIYRDMNNAYGRLNNNINKAAAGSNALAALHPLDYDPDDKADFTAGYGHYRNANAAAVGVFYHPNENTMVNVGVSLGNGDPGFNAGVSFKVGRGGAGREAMSRTEMTKVINSQSKEIDALKKDNADKDKRIDALEQKIAEILAKLDKNGK